MIHLLEEFDLWLPLALDVNQKSRIGPMNIVRVIARLRPGVTLEAARADLSVIRERQRQAFPYIFSDLEVGVIRLHAHLVGDVRLSLLALFGAVASVLLIACANVANLLMARSAARQKEMAIRAALGAGRFRLVRQLLTESLLLSFAGGAVGLLMATRGVKLLVRMSPGGIARIAESGPSSLLDGRVLGFTCMVVALAGLAAGVIPALYASKTNVNETLKAKFNARAGRPRGRRALQSLMIGEVALTLVLLVGAGLMIKSFFRLLAVPKGFNPDNVLTLVLSPSYAKYPPGSPQRRAYFQESLTRVQTLPGVQSASLTSFLPLAGSSSSQSFKIEGRPPFDPGKEPSAQDNLINHDYFRTMGIEMRAGRAFTEQDGAEAPPVVIIFVVRLLVGAGVRREIDFEVRQFQGLDDVLTVLVSFDRDALDLDPGINVLPESQIASAGPIFSTYWSLLSTLSERLSRIFELIAQNRCIIFAQ